jgi:hypothetical protein
MWMIEDALAADAIAIAPPSMAIDCIVRRAPGALHRAPRSRGRMGPYGVRADRRACNRAAQEQRARTASLHRAIEGPSGVRRRATGRSPFEHYTAKKVIADLMKAVDAMFRALKEAILAHIARGSVIPTGTTERSGINRSRASGLALEASTCSATSCGCGVGNAWRISLSNASGGAGSELIVTKAQATASLIKHYNLQGGRHGQGTDQNDGPAA